MCDLEGNSLGKPPGTVSLFQLILPDANHTWVFDVTKFGRKVFYMMGTRGQSICKLLEDDDISTGWWDCRNDANALWFHFQVQLNPDSTVDLQYLELATRARGECRDRRLGLDKAVGPEGVRSGTMSHDEALQWTMITLNGKEYFKTNSKGYGIFDMRPLPELAIQYAGGDTKHMHMLYTAYMARMRYAENSFETVGEETKKAINLACGESRVLGARSNIFAPPAFQVYYGSTVVGCDDMDDDW